MKRIAEDGVIGVIGIIFLLIISSSFIPYDGVDERLHISGSVDEQKRAELEELFNIDDMPEITLSFKLNEWNQLLAYYDEDKDNNNFVKCNLRVKYSDKDILLDTIGVRIRGAWSRNRPEGKTGQMHMADETDWHHCSFAINLNKYTKGEDRTVGEAVRKHNVS